jgi:hypothetical protein
LGNKRHWRQRLFSDRVPSTTRRRSTRGLPEPAFFFAAGNKTFSRIHCLSVTSVGQGLSALMWRSSGHGKRLYDFRFPYFSNRLQRSIMPAHPGAGGGPDSIGASLSFSILGMWSMKLPLVRCTIWN